MTLISAGLSAKQNTLTTSSALSVSSISAATLSATSSITLTGVGDVAAALSGKQAALTTSSALSVASVTTTALNTMSGGLRISGGNGFHGTGGVLRLLGTFDLVNNPSAIYWGGANVETHVQELSQPQTAT